MTANRSMALRVVWGTRVDDHTPADDARELLAMLGLIEPDGREILPDDTRVVHVETGSKAPGGKNANPSSPLAFAEHGRRPENCTTPPGLRDLPSLPAAPPAKKRGRRGLQAELEELERTDPEVAAAAVSYDRMVERITGRPMPQPSPETARLIAAGVNPDTAAILGEKTLIPDTPRWTA